MLGIMLKQNVDISNLKRSSATDFIAEVFFEELQFILGTDLEDILIVRNHGMNSRSESRDVIDVESQYISSEIDYKEHLVLHLSRNSLYHALPENLFEPLSLSTPSMSNREVVDAIRANRLRSKRNLEFFSLFDTELFKQRVQINNRCLNFLSDEKAKENLLNIAKKLLDTPLFISKQSWYKLFLNLCHTELFKENLLNLEKLIEVVLDIKTQIKYLPHAMDEMPYLPLGEASLGINLGLCGKVQSEIDDVEVTILLDEPIEDYDELQKNSHNIETVLQFFILSSRTIFIKHKIVTNTSFVLGNNYLGYDTYL